MMSNQSVAVRASNLTKVFGRAGSMVTAVDGISFEIFSGEIFGFLGPNGAGKTTTLEIVEGLQTPTTGAVSILGESMPPVKGDRIKSRMGVQLQEQAYFKFLRLDELLIYLASLYRRDIDPVDLLSRVGLAEKSKSLVKQLSGGQQRRFSVAAALVNDPDLIFLDEPTSGIDPQARRLLWDLISELRRQGKTIVITTHYMDEAQSLCDRVAIMDRGRIQALDAPLRLIQALDGAYHIRFTTPSGDHQPELFKFDGVVGHTFREGGSVVHHDLLVKDSGAALIPFSKRVGEHGIRLGDLRVEPASLEDVFLSLTGRALRD